MSHDSFKTKARGSVRHQNELLFAKREGGDSFKTKARGSERHQNELLFAKRV